MLMVKIVRASDGKWPVYSIISIKEFLTMVEYVLANGGEMPIAQLESS